MKLAHMDAAGMHVRMQEPRPPPEVCRLAGGPCGPGAAACLPAQDRGMAYLEFRPALQLAGAAAAAARVDPRQQRRIGLVAQRAGGAHVRCECGRAADAVRGVQPPPQEFFRLRAAACFKLRKVRGCAGSPHTGALLCMPLPPSHALCTHACLTKAEIATPLCKHKKTLRGQAPIRKQC